MDSRAQSPGSRALRRGRSSIAGQVYLITTATHRRQRLYADWCTASHACAALTERRLWRDSTLLCWVLMPDHLHLLVALGDSEPLSRLLQRVKAVVAKASVVERHARSRSIWMAGYHDHALRADQDVVATARYIIANPLRAGLVRSVRDYPYWDAIWLQDS